MAAVFSMTNGLTLPIYLLFFLAPMLVWLVMLVPLRPAWAQQLQRLEAPEATVARVLVALITAVLLLRTVVGTLAWQHVSNLWVVGLFYPIRIASPNYGALAGLPWFVLVLTLAFYWPRLTLWLNQVRYRFVAQWLVATGVLLAFAGIEGGLVNGVSGIYSSKEHLYDLRYVSWTLDFLTEHLQRIAGNLQPAYVTSHFTTHPPLSLQLFSLVNPLGPFGMGLMTIVLFALAFPLLDSLLTAGNPTEKHSGATALLLTTPGFLVYAGSDDAHYYLLWACALVLAWWGIRGKSVLWSIAAGLVIALACNVTYASLVLIPGVMAFTTDRTMGELPLYLKQHFLYLATVVLTVALALVTVAAVSGFNVLDGMALVMRYQESYLFKNLLVTDPIRALSDRMMTIFDFTIFAGPVMLATWFMALKQRRASLLQWSIPGAAFVVLLAYIAITTPGAGESGRGWGGLYLLWWVGCGMGLARQWSTATVNNLVRFALAYAALGQLLVDFGW